MDSTYSIVLETDKSTVVTEYKKLKRTETSYQSEAALEKEFIDLLQTQGYEYFVAKSEEELVLNLRKQLEKLNNIIFTDNEWDDFFNTYIANKNEGIVEKSKTIQEDYIKVLKRENGSSQNITLIDKKDIHNNYLQVINQYEANDGVHKNRYDVTILVNGLPLVHIELKRRGVALKEAFNQINRYQRESFFSESGLFEYVQIFVISNGTSTKYYSNTTRERAIKENEGQAKSTAKKTSNSFEFTSYWADAKNTTLPDLVDFTKTFFAKHTILNILTKYCVWTVDNMLLVMRPYQIVATEKILNKIIVRTNYKKVGTVDAGGYVWHTTGSGKTLTSFKTAKLAASLPFIDKVLFVVDRRDLDYQTMREYDKFEKGAANGNRSTEVLTRQLKEPKEKSSILVTTIQKLSQFVKKGSQSFAPTDDTDVFNKHIVMIFDECHRSQFGEMHTLITKKFKNYHLFGFTGTPIFPENSNSGNKPDLKTTEQAFGERLHTYTIVDAIRDNNVLPFRIDYINTIKQKDTSKDKQVTDIEREKALNNPKRIQEIVEYILEHFNQKTKRDSNAYEFRKVLNIPEIVQDREIEPAKRVKAVYSQSGSRIKGFNSILCVQSIDMAKTYYDIFKEMMIETGQNLKIAIIYSFSPNSDDNSNGNLDEEGFDTNALATSDREFLDNAISEYNKMFNTNYDSSGEGFENYYKDVSHRMKNKDLDLLIVVNMFLTGFDATTLNTLWVDKNLRQHGLIQAFSRTNRILNSVKTYGNIVCFRDLTKNVDDAIAMFGDRDATGVVLLKSYKEYYDEYIKLVNELYTKFPIGEAIVSEKSKKEFVVLFGKILRLRNILSAFDEFVLDKTMTDRDLQDYTSMYNDIYAELKPKVDGDKESILDDVVFELELVKQIEVNIDYILMLVEKYHQSNCKNKEILVDIDKAIKSSPGLRSKKELIDNFLETINVDSKVAEDFKKYVVEKRENDLQEIISDNNLDDERAREFVKNAFRDGELKLEGQDFDKLIPKTSFFDSNRVELKEKVANILKEYYDKYSGILE
ncbi:MAG: type I restriction endonuclease subunit R [Lachnospiraceae bacterium]|nr:type I restriction endonuclease subunit R [Lachnospiraceae bacterium]